MTPADVLDVARDTIFTLIQVAGPIMAVGLVVGLFIAFFQALTQIQAPICTIAPSPASAGARALITSIAVSGIP